jgi:hypothetical protein
MDNEDKATSASRAPSIREEFEGFMRSIFSSTEEQPKPEPRPVTRSSPHLIPPPPMLDAEKSPPKIENGRRDTAEEVAVMLRDLFDAQDTFLISNAGVQSIIDGLLRRYRERESAVLREKLLVHWRQDVPRLRAALLEAAKDDPLVLETGQEVSLVTTVKAQALLDRFCPQTAYLPETRGTRDVR